MVDKLITAMEKEDHKWEKPPVFLVKHALMHTVSMSIIWHINNLVTPSWRSCIIQLACSCMHARSPVAVLWLAQIGYVTATWKSYIAFMLKSHYFILWYSLHLQYTSHLMYANLLWLEIQYCYWHPQTVLLQHIQKKSRSMNSCSETNSHCLRPGQTHYKNVLGGGHWWQKTYR